MLAGSLASVFTMAVHSPLCLACLDNLSAVQDIIDDSLVQIRGMKCHLGHKVHVPVRDAFMGLSMESCVFAKTL